MRTNAEKNEIDKSWEGNTFLLSARRFFFSINAVFLPLNAFFLEVSAEAIEYLFF